MAFLLRSISLLTIYLTAEQVIIEMNFNLIDKKNVYKEIQQQKNYKIVILFWFYEHKR